MAAPPSLPLLPSDLGGAATRSDASEHRRAIALLIGGFTLLRLLLAATAPLLPQEAYYGSWSLHPAPDYFDHPPLATYGIWMSTALFGSTSFGIKLSAVAWSLGLNLLLTQALLVTPWLFGLSLTAFWRGLRAVLAGRADARTRLLLASAAVPLLLFAAVSLRSLVKLNGLAPACWPLIVLGMHGLLERGFGMRRLKWGLSSSAALLLAAGLGMLTPSLPMLGGLNSWAGWNEAARQLDPMLAQARSRGERVFVFSPNYKISSLLRCHLSGHPRTYAQDIYGAPALQFDHFPLEGDMQGATGLLVMSGQMNSRLQLERVAPYFDRLEKVQAIEIHGAFDRTTRRVEIYRGTHYKGQPRLAGRQAPPGNDGDTDTE